MKNFEGYVEGNVFHCELEDLPNVIEVRLPDKRGGNRVRSARVWDYIPEPECETDETGFVTRVRLDGFWYVPERRGHTMSCSAYDGVSFYLNDRTVCSECGGRLTDNRLEHVRYRYCPWCGAKLVEMPKVRQVPAEA